MGIFDKLVTIKEVCTLPSKGIIYGIEGFNPKVTIRSMTNAEDLSLTSIASQPEGEYKKLCELIEGCIEEKLPISVYDMCLGDYEFLLHKLRIVSYSKDYKMTVQCPNCRNIVNSSTDLDSLEVNEFNAEEIGDRVITLPVTGYKIKLSFQTPRMLDEIAEKAKDYKRKKKTKGVNYELLFEIMSYISKVDGEIVDEPTLEELVLKLPTKDAKYIKQKGRELNRKVGLDTSNIIAKCPECGYEVLTPFQYQPEFFNPQISED